MIATLDRYAYLQNGTAGTLTIGNRSFVTVERPWKANQRFISCIPEGDYTCRAYTSNRFPDVWEILNVPKRDAILFHGGNMPADVQGCIAVGQMEGNRDPFWILNSQKALHEMRESLPDVFELVIRPYSTKNHKGYL